MTIKNKRELAARALSRLSQTEQQRERNHSVIPWELSLYALADYFAKAKSEFGAWLFDSSDKPSDKSGNKKNIILAAVSGGGDSVAMLWLLRAFSAGQVIVAHVNHSLRGAESDGDAEFVQALAHDWGLPFITRKLDVRRLSLNGESLELAARRLRHEALYDMASETGAALIALGHNRDDLAETVLFNLLRGTGVRGAVGIPVQREKFFRPVLGLRREFLRKLLTVRNISWREDCTNQDHEISMRNFIRLKLLPLIESRVNAGAIEHLAAFAEEMRGARSYEEQRAVELLDGLGLVESPRESGLNATLNRKKAVKLPDYERALILRAIGQRLELPTLSRSRVNELSRLIACSGPFTFQWSGSVTVQGTSGVVQFIVPRADTIQQR